MQGCFITGTGTDVGKTVVTAGLLRALLDRNVDAIAVKPIQTGCPETLLPSDPIAYEKASGHDYSLHSPGDLCRYRFQPACSPHLAASMADTKLTATDVVDSIRRAAKGHEFTLVEGAGGILVPINRDQTMLDIARLLDIPTLIVVNNGLGCINHSLLTAQSLQNAGLAVLGFIVNNVEPITDSDRFIRADNPPTITQHSRLPILAQLPHIPDFSIDSETAWRQVAAALGSAIDRMQ